MERSADLGGNAQLAAVQQERVGESAFQNVADETCELVFPLPLRYQDRKAVAGDPRHAVGVGCQVPHALGHYLEQGIARLPAKAVVDHPEAVEVDLEQRESTVIAAGRREVLGQTLL